MKLKGNLVTPERTGYGEIEWQDARIVAVSPSAEIRPGEPWILPGFIDLHLHGLGPFTTEDGSAGLCGMASFAAEKGTTRLAPAWASAPRAETVDWIRCVRDLTEDPPEGARIAGSHLEGPWLSHRFGGGMNASMLRDPDLDEAREYLDAAGGSLRLVTLAPELPRALEAAALLKANGVTVSLGHSDCPPDFFGTAVENGISQLGFRNIKVNFKAIVIKEHTLVFWIVAINAEQLEGYKILELHGVFVDKEQTEYAGVDEIVFAVTFLIC